MIYKGKTNTWPEYTEQMFERHFKSADFNVYMGQSMNAQCQIDKDKVKNIDLVVVYDELETVFVIWNTDVHQKLHAGVKITFSIGKSKIRKKTTNSIEFLKHSLSGTNGQNKAQEQVAIVPKNKLFEFLEHFDVYFKKFIADNDSDVLSHEFQRKIDAINRYRRDPQFRERVLHKYNSTCVVCGNQDEIILEAAHVIAVGEGGDDNVDNGICLCANHHRMYDAALLNIDLAEQTFKYNGDVHLHSVWYDEAKKRGFRLFIEKRDNES